MYKKSCPVCKGDSYSATSRGSWECPYCRTDLSLLAPATAECANTLTPGDYAVVPGRIC